MKLAADGTRFAPGSAIITPNVIRAELIAQYQTLEFNGYVQDAKGFARGLIVEKAPVTRTGLMCCGPVC